jgi:thiamine-monophosphate kinase
VSTDSFIEGVHFTPSIFSPYNIGYKALGSALSDIAASGAKPTWYLLNLGIKKNQTIKEIKSIFKGLQYHERKYSIKLLGGDTTRSPFLFLSITVGGTTKKTIPRNQAKKGDRIYLTGNIGGSNMGLYSLQKKIKSNITKYHLTPEIRCEEALKLTRKYRINSMIDISDGFLIDANHIAEESGKRLDIIFKNIPICPECRKFAKKHSLNLEENVLTSGEEFELLFTSPDVIKETFVSEIGYVSRGNGVYIDGELTPPRGYSHFE